MRRLLFLSLFIFCLVLGVGLNRVNHLREVYRSICDLTEEHFYQDDERLASWLSQCHRHAAQISFLTSVDQLLSDVQNLMNEMGVSHFQIYNPVQDRRLWKSESIDTGIRSRFVEDQLVIYRVLAKSTAAEADVRVGDSILQIAGADQLTPWVAEHRTGRFKLRRGTRELEVNLTAQPFVIDEAPKWTRLNHGTALLEIPSFRSEFFARDEWLDVARQVMAFDHLIVDVRENAGGNFVAMLRALSSLQCGGIIVGSLLKPRNHEGRQTTFSDNTSDQFQIQELDQFHRLYLKTFSDYGCFKGRITVLVGPETSSVAEIFAESFLHNPRYRVWGQPTSGDVVLAVWYDLPALGNGFTVSIPEATYVTAKNQSLEGHGVEPQKTLYYDLKRSLLGKDNWVEQALR